MGPYRIIQDHMGQYRTMEHAAPYGILGALTGPYGTLQDNTGPYGTMYGTIWDQT